MGQEAMSDLVKGGSKYSDDQRRRAVIEYCVHGVMTRVSELTGIPEQTLATWKNQSEWWDNLVVQARNEINEKILAQNMEIAAKAGELVLDSLENGDEKLIWDKSKEKHVIKRVKPSGKDAAVIGGISQDKARVQLNLPTSITGKPADMEELAKKFAELSRTWKEKKVNAIPGDSEEIERYASKS